MNDDDIIKALLFMNSYALDVTSRCHVGKTDRCLCTRVKEHSCHDSFEIYNHICSCKRIQLYKEYAGTKSLRRR